MTIVSDDLERFMPAAFDGKILVSNVFPGVANERMERTGAGGERERSARLEDVTSLPPRPSHMQDDMELTLRL